MEIRMLESTDHLQLLPLWKGYQTFYKADIADTLTHVTWQRLRDPVEPMHWAVAEVDGALAGVVPYTYHRSCWTKGDSGCGG